MLGWVWVLPALHPSIQPRQLYRRSDLIIDRQIIRVATQVENLQDLLARSAVNTDEILSELILLPRDQIQPRIALPYIALPLPPPRKCPRSDPFRCPPPWYQRTKLPLRRHLRSSSRKKSEVLAQVPTSMQPPTGPKADRAEPPPSEFRSRRESFSDSWTKQEVSVRVSKPPTGPAGGGAPKQGSEQSPPIAPASMLSRDQVTGPVEPLSQDGPSTGTAPSTPTSLGFARGPPSLGRAGSPGPPTSPRLPFSSVPTGPRALQPRPPAPPRGPTKGSKQWVRPGYSRVFAPNATRRDPLDEKEFRLAVGDDRKLDSYLSPDEQLKREVDLDMALHVADSEVDEDTAQTTTHPDDVVMESKGCADDGFVEVPPTAGTSNLVEEPVDASLIPDFMPSSDEEDNNVFNEEDLNERKALYERAMQALEAEMPPPTLEDPVIVNGLLKIQLLDMITELALPIVPPDSEAGSVERNTNQGGTCKTETDTDNHGHPMHAPIHSVPTIDFVTVENLPFLQSGPLTPLSDLEVYQENVKTHDCIREALCRELARQRRETVQMNVRLRDEYASYYKPWRLAVWELDHRKDEKKVNIPAATTPPSVVPAMPVSEGRRFKGNSELDFQNALRASAISAQEESERRRQMEATARPDLDREAVIPDMFESQQQKAGLFQDLNNAVDVTDAVVVFGFHPPPNDFTPEEHKAFTDAFMAYPKKWGKIADELPGRDFQQCILHYYLTKEEIKYKADRKSVV